MNSSSRKTSRCLVAQFRDSKDTLQYQEAGKQDSVILQRRKGIKMEENLNLKKGTKHQGPLGKTLSVYYLAMCPSEVQ